MLTLQVPLREAEKVKKQLIERNYFAAGYKLCKEGDYVYFPVTQGLAGYSLVEKELVSVAKGPVTLKEALEGKIPTEVLEKLKTAYDTVGTIAILEIDDYLSSYDALIGETLLSINRNLKTALAKDAGHEGVFRTQKMRYLAGEDTRETIHKENGVSLFINVEEVYYSTRMATERKRVMELVKPGENVLCMFAGSGPYTCVISKNTQAASVVGVEINPAGHALALRNITKNKLTNATTYCGDVRDIVPGLVSKQGLFDRITMPLPKLAETFLDVALAAAKPGATIHFYAFLHEDEYTKAHDWINEACAKKGIRAEIRENVRCGQQAPHVFRFCIDFVTC